MASRIGWRAAAVVAVTLCSGAGPLSDRSTADDVLGLMQDRGKDLRSFTADLTQTVQDLGQGNVMVYGGKVIFQAFPNGDARIHLGLDTKRVGNGPVVAEKKEYQIENGWVTDRDYRMKSENRRQLVPAGQKVDLFQLGKGTFPLPIGQDKAEVLKLFDVQKVPADKADPPGTIHLQLTPKKGTSFARQFTTVDFWVDTAQRMPVRIETVDAQGVMDQTNDLTNVKVNPPPQPGDFVLQAVPPTWTTDTKPLAQ